MQIIIIFFQGFSYILDEETEDEVDNVQSEPDYVQQETSNKQDEAGIKQDDFKKQDDDTGNEKYDEQNKQAETAIIKKDNSQNDIGKFKIATSSRNHSDKLYTN